MRYREILEACWSGYQQQGMKKKGDRQVPNCVRVTETQDQKFAIASYPIPGDKFRLTINNRPFILTPGGFGKQHSQYFLDSFYLTDMKSGKTEFVDSRWKWPLAQAIYAHLDQNHADALVRIGKADFAWHEENNDWDSQPPRLQGIRRQTSVGIPAKDFIKSVDAVKRVTGQDRDSVSEQQMEEDLKKWFREKWVRFGPDGRIRGDCARGSSKEGKPKCLPQSKAHALGKKGRASAAAKKRREDPNAERRGPARNVATKVKEGSNNNDDWYDDADEFGMPGSEFFPDDDRLRDGDYVRDRQDGESGEIFRMSGDPTERRVRILDRDGKGWYISPERLVAVDRNDPDVMRYFGKRRHRDMDEASVAKKPQPYNDPKWIDKLTPAERSRLAGPNYKKINQEKQKQKEKVDEKQDACYRKVKSRYKVWPSAYASGALVQCRKKGAANWGTGAKKK